VAAELIDVAKILALLPHRFPFVMVDRVTELEPGVLARGHKSVAYNEPWFPGHFPGRPIMPGVLVVEALAQLGGILAHASDPTAGSDGALTVFLGIDKARFRRPVVPGDRLDLEARVLQRRARLWRFAGTARVDGAVAAEAVLMATSVDASKLG
jgi:3-hydroxyacyl-[acyl-carrier-protein] dehydratase